MRLDWEMPLRSAGTVQIVVKVNLDELADDERAAVLSLIGGFHDYLTNEFGYPAPRLTTVPQ